MHKINNINIYIKSTKVQNHYCVNCVNKSNEIIRMKKEIEIRDNKIKELLKSVDNLKNINQENDKLKKEIIHLNNIIKNSNNSNNTNTSNDDKNSKISKKVVNTDNNKYNTNLITYNINKNNNYNIINSNINHFENLNINQNNKEEDTLLKNAQESKKEEMEKVVENESDKDKDKFKDKEKDKDKENDINKETEKDKKATRAFERFKRAHKSVDLSNKEKGCISKSDKISIIAKMLEGHLGNNEKISNRKSSVDIVYNKNENEDRFENNINNEIINIINDQPVVNKRKKKMSCFSLES